MLVKVSGPDTTMDRLEKGHGICTKSYRVPLHNVGKLASRRMTGEETGVSSQKE